MKATGKMPVRTQKPGCRWPILPRVKTCLPSLTLQSPGSAAWEPRELEDGSIFLSLSVLMAREEDVPPL